MGSAKGSTHPASWPPCRRLSHRRISFRRSVVRFGMCGTVHLSGWHFRPGFGGPVMRLSSSLVAPSAVAILSAALLCGPSGPAMSQTELPKITVVAPKQVARPQRPVARPQRPARVANTVASRPTPPTTQTPAPAKDSVMAKLAALEKTASSCADGCATSFKHGNQPWNGCSTTGDLISTTCRNGRNYKTYVECMDAGRFLAWRNAEIRWYCSSLHAAGKLAGEKVQVAELKRSARR
jgi:hypothetical protein